MANPARAQLSDLPLYGIKPEAFANIPDATKQAALNEASDLLDGYLPSRFTLPLTAPYSLDIISFECVVASYTLLCNRGYFPKGVDEVLDARYKQKIAWAEAIAREEIYPRASDASTDNSQGGPFVITSTQRGYSERGIASSLPHVNVDPYTGD